MRSVRPVIQAALREYYYINAKGTREERSERIDDTSKFTICRGREKLEERGGYDQDAVIV